MSSKLLVSCGYCSKSMRDNLKGHTSTVHSGKPVLEGGNQDLVSFIHKKWSLDDEQTNNPKKKAQPQGPQLPQAAEGQPEPQPPDIQAANAQQPQLPQAAAAAVVNALEPVQDVDKKSDDSKNIEQILKLVTELHQQRDCSSTSGQ